MTSAQAYPWTLPVPAQPKALAASLRGMIPQLTTDRLVLRASELRDFPAFETIMAADVHGYMGGPFGTEDAWLDFCQGVAGWSLRGQGMWTVTLAQDDDAIGFVVAMCAFGDQETELGYLFLSDRHGQGFASEAVRAVRDYAWDIQAVPSMVSYADPKNTRSVALAERIGALHDKSAALPNGETPEDTAVMRHNSERRS